MIVIPMLGRSSRFSSCGYVKPKYQLPLGDETLFTKSLRSFEQYFSNEHFLFLVRSDHNAREFVLSELSRVGIVDFRIKEFDFETRGQAESVYLGLSDYTEELPVLIFNIDTIRKNFTFPSNDLLRDGFLEVFNGEGDNWSFVKPLDSNRVEYTTEKERISNLCSNGIYGFSKIYNFRLAYEAYIRDSLTDVGEIYIAPLYNHLIKNGFDITYIMLEDYVTLHSGLPETYEALKKILK